MGRYNDNHGLFSMDEFKNRGAIKLSPDALVFISGNFGTSIIAPVSGQTQKVDFQDGISSISVSNNIDPPGSSSATIEVVTPIYNEKSRYWISMQGDNGRTYKVPFFVPMMEIKIFFKGRFLVQNEPKYYPAFWGFIVNVEENFSGGLYKITLQCADMLHWWQYINVAYHPSVASNIITGYRLGLTAFASRYEKSNAFEIIYSLVTEMGYENFTAPDWLAKATQRYDIFPSQAVDYIYGGILDYWRKRWASAPNLLRMYGATGKLIIDPRKPVVEQPNTRNSAKDTKKDKAKQASQSKTVMSFGIDDDFTRGFQVFHVFDKMGNLENAEYMTKLEIAVLVRNTVEYEFFQDVNGNIIFKPPFYNLNTKNVFPYRIAPQDILSCSSSTNSEEIVTALQVQASIQKNIWSDEWVNELGYHMDMGLTKRYGERFKKISLWYMSEGGLVRSIAMGHLSLMNVKAFTGTVTMPGRPEMRLGYPVYIEHKDTFYYVRSINHAFDYGGSFTTTLSLEGLRERIYGKTDTGNWEIQKNRIYKLKDPKSLIIKPGQEIDENKTFDQISAEQQTDPDVKLEELYREHGYINSSDPGRYEIVEDGSVQSILSKQPAADKSGKVKKGFVFRRDVIPYTDEEGYKVIGSFRYGRGIILNPGKIMDGFEMAATEEKPSDEVKSERDAHSITNFVPTSEREGAEMQKYFGVVRSKNIESAIPAYLELAAEEGLTTGTAAVQLANLSVGGFEEMPPEVPTVGTIQASNAETVQGAPSIGREFVKRSNQGKQVRDSKLPLNQGTVVPVWSSILLSPAPKAGSLLYVSTPAIKPSKKTE